jgi:hypothetical protein
VVGELSHLAQRGNHAEGKNTALARRQCLVAPNFAPAIFAHQPLKFAVEIIDVAQRSLYVFVAQNLPTFDQTAIIKILVHNSTGT